MRVFFQESFFLPPPPPPLSIKFQVVERGIFVSHVSKNIRININVYTFLPESTTLEKAFLFSLRADIVPDGADNHSVLPVVTHKLISSPDNSRPK